MAQLKVLSEDGKPVSLQCPHCNVEIGQLIEEDTAVRWNRAEPEFENGRLILNYGTGQADFEHTGYVCEMCHKNVELPSQYSPSNDTLSETWS